jgi:Na+-transporting methylmalonyl-CoA/oxaloacetate decarboxylase beta subunit
MFNEYVTLGESIIISIFCMVVVFIALFAISYIVDITRFFVVKKEKKNIAKNLGVDALDAASIGIIGSADGPTKMILSSKEKEEDDTELVAVITAAIAALTGTNASGFAIKNIKRLPDSDTAWSRIGRIELMR